MLMNWILTDSAKLSSLSDEDKKWLRRLWRDGLDQPNSRRKEQLKQLANHLGLLDSRQLWESNVAVSVSAMMQTNLAGFIQVAVRTCAYFATLQHLHLRCPQEIDELLQRNECHSVRAKALA